MLRRIASGALATGLVLASGAAGAHGRGMPEDNRRPQPTEALRKRLAEQRIFDVVQNGLRLTPPAPPVVIQPPRSR